MTKSFREETTLSHDLRNEVERARGDRSLGASIRAIEVKTNPPEFKLREGICRIGAGKDNEIVLNHPTVSRSHVELSIVPEGIRVRDLQSRNGTFYLGQRVGEIVLSLGARIQLGAVSIALDADTDGFLTAPEYSGESYRGILGVSPRIRKLFALLQRLEGSLATVLVEGESGAGKEGVARAIHEGSPVSSGKLVVVNCGAIARELVASELFGHRRGAFTGATDARRGAFDSANGGTLFLDEIGELPLDVQPALLRAIELGEIRPLGTDEPHTVKVRLVAATNRDLLAEVAAGRFREDLFYRLAVVRLQVPPLRARVDDIPLLANHFAAAAGSPPLAANVIEELKGRPWPGNARELRNAVQAFLAIGQMPPVTAAPHSASFGEDATIDPTIPYAEQKEAMVEQFTRSYVRALLRYTNGNQAAAARIGKLDRTTLGRLMTKYGLHVRRVD